MFFISPIKAVYSIKFYLQKLQESFWKTLLFFVYVFVIAAAFLAVYVPYQMSPTINEGIDKVAELMPDIVVDNGIITANNNRRTVIEDASLQNYKIIFDTASEEPGYPTQMEKEHVLIYVNKNAVYANLNGQFQETKMEKSYSLTLSGQEMRNSKSKIASTIKYFFVLVAVFAVALRMFIFTILALRIALIISVAYKLNLSFKKLLILAMCLQAPIVIIDMVLMLLPFQIMGMHAIVALIVFVVYLNLICSALRAADNTPAKRIKALLDDEEDE